VIEATAAEATALEGEAYEAVAESVQEVTGPSDQGASPEREASRRWLRDALLRQPGVGFLKAYDTELFILINNHTPRTAASDTFFKQLSLWFTGGWAWVLGVALAWPFRRAWVVSTLKQIALPIWVATLIVEGPIKMLFRRHRPYIDIVRAIVVGKKPGNWSFPSGHSASAFAGARMLDRRVPRWRLLWYTLAGLVGFSRIYVGAHYPGDVISGSIFGLILAELTRWVMRRFSRPGSRRETRL
jgi:undecaprenyl-diphosphatase